MGLAVVYGFVQRHGGAITIQTARGEGTQVSLLLPGSELAIQPVEEDPEPISGELRILVVDDQETIGELVAEMIRVEGHVARVVRDGLAALEALEAEAWDLVVSDQSMPVMTGSELAVEIRSRGWRMPVVLLTGFGEEMRAQGEPPAGINLVVCKPLTRMGLREALHAVGDDLRPRLSAFMTP